MLQFQSFWVFKFWISNGRGNILRSWGPREANVPDVPGVQRVHGILRYREYWRFRGSRGFQGPRTGSHFSIMLSLTYQVKRCHNSKIAIKRTWNFWIYNGSFIFMIFLSPGNDVSKKWILGNMRRHIINIALAVCLVLEYKLSTSLKLRVSQF